MTSERELRWVDELTDSFTGRKVALYNNGLQDQPTGNCPIRLAEPACSTPHSLDSCMVYTIGQPPISTFLRISLSHPPSHPPSHSPSHFPSHFLQPEVLEVARLLLSSVHSGSHLDSRLAFRNSQIVILFALQPSIVFAMFALSPWASQSRVVWPLPTATALDGLATILV